ncbi:MAG: IscS subfamily cysteine desulfurase, partial [Chitinophagaceae bacterium]
MQLPVYLDYNATTPCDARVIETMLPYFGQKFGNAASRSHAFGWQAEAAVDEARAQVAQLLGADPTEMVFTSGATEAVNLAIKGVYETYSSKGAHIITVKTEHKAVLDTCKHLEKLGAEVTYLPVDEKGLISLSELETAIRPTTILIAVMYANNETGVIQPIKEIGALAKSKDVIFFTDATQAVGKVDIDVQRDGIDLLALSAHKIYGPKGVGALYVRRRGPRVRLAAQLHGGGHERGMRSGTLNVPGIVGLGKAAEIARQGLKSEGERLNALRNKLQTALLQIEATRVNGDAENRLPGTTNMVFEHVDGQGLMMALKGELALSSGSACTSASIEPSHVLRALGITDEMAHSSLRFGLGRFTTDEEIDFTIEKVTAAVQQLRA